MGELEGFCQVILSDNAEPRRLAHGPVLVERLVHNVPSEYPALIASDHCMDVVSHALEQRFAGQRLTSVVFEHPTRSLAMPHEAMPDDRHLVLFTEGDVAVRRLEIVAAGARM